MNIKRQATILFVKDLQRSKKFFVSVLGLTPQLDFSSVIFFDEGIAIWQLNPEEKLHEMLGKNFYQHDKVKSELYFEVSDFDSVVKQLNKHDIKLVHEVHREEHGQRTIRFYDPDVHLIEIGETLETFLQRDYEAGMSIVDLSKKHHLSQKQIKKLINQ